MTQHEFKRSDLRAFLDRDWSLPRRLQAQETAELARRMNWNELLRRADQLRDAARLLMPEWPNAKTREEDLIAHRELAQKLLTYQARRLARAAGDRSRHEAREGAVVPVRSAGGPSSQTLLRISRVV